MSVSTIDAVGLVGDAIGIIGFFVDLIPEDAPDGSAVTIKAGLANLNADEANHGGQISAVYAYNNDNEYLGQSANHYVGDGDTHMFTVDQGSGSAQAGYISVANNNDGTCVAWVTVEQKDATRGGAWTGDIGRECGQRWFASIEQAGVYADENGEEQIYRPACTWIDKDFTDDTLSAAFKFRVRAYGDDVGSTFDNAQWCDSTIFSEESDAISAAPAKKRDVLKRPDWIIEQLVIQALNSGVTAEELCGSKTSWGPDYIGSDQKFCDMADKVVSPLCELEDVKGCVEYDEVNQSLTKRSSIARRSVKTHHKSYKVIKKAQEDRSTTH